MKESVPQKRRHRGRDAHGLVYVIGPWGFRHVKIGFTAGDPQDRIDTLQVGNHEELVLFAALRGTMFDESVLQARFVAHRERGEWFRNEGELKVWLHALSVHPLQRSVAYARLTGWVQDFGWIRVAS